MNGSTHWTDAPTDLSDEIGEAARAIRQERNITTRIFAARLGTTPEEARDIEEGRVSLTTSDISLLSDALGVGVGRLLERATR